MYYNSAFQVNSFQNEYLLPQNGVFVRRNELARSPVELNRSFSGYNRLLRVMSLLCSIPLQNDSRNNSAFKWRKKHLGDATSLPQPHLVHSITACCSVLLSHGKRSPSSCSHMTCVGPTNQLLTFACLLLCREAPPWRLLSSCILFRVP